MNVRAMVEAASKPAGAITSSLVMLRFYGVFESGPLTGEPFAGTFAYNQARAPSEQHIGHCRFDRQPEPMVKLTVGGVHLVSSLVCVFAGIGDGLGNAYDLVTVSGEGRGGREFELFLADPEDGTLAADALPSEPVLRAMAARTLTLFQGGSASAGEFHFDRPH